MMSKYPSSDRDDQPCRSPKCIWKIYITNILVSGKISTASIDRLPMTSLIRYMYILEMQNARMPTFTKHFLINFNDTLLKHPQKTQSRVKMNLFCITLILSFYNRQVFEISSVIEWSPRS